MIYGYSLSWAIIHIKVAQILPWLWSFFLVVVVGQSEWKGKKNFHYVFSSYLNGFATRRRMQKKWRMNCHKSWHFLFMVNEILRQSIQMVHYLAFLWFYLGQTDLMRRFLQREWMSNWYHILNKPIWKEQFWVGGTHEWSNFPF